MWEVLVNPPLGSLSKRKFIMLIATFLVAVFGYLFISPTDVYAADAKWNGEAISYDAKDFNGPITAVDNDKSGLPKDTIYYATYDSASPTTRNEGRGYLIYFPKNTQTEKATSAFYSEGEYDQATGRFSNLSPPEKLSLDVSTYGSDATLQASSCDVDGIGWVICPVSRWIAQGMDFLYGFIESYLQVAPLSDGNNGIYQMWEIVRNFANIAFIIAFLILIYAQVTGSVMSNYTLKKMLPRVVVAAILVNISYWICAVGVDISNVTGASVRQLFLVMFDQLGAANSAADDIGWEKVTAIALGGAGAAGLATLGLFGATGGGAGAFAFLIIGALIPALFAIFVAIVILAARQALITIFIIISPLAFVAYLLPNTEEWFNRWRKLFMSLLIMFPAFALVFGGSQLAGKLIIQNANNLPVVILGLVVQVVPLFITPFLIRLSSGVLSTIAGLANDRSKGVFDRAQNWAKGNQELHKARAVNRGLQPRSQTSGIRPLTSIGARAAMRTKNRENRTQAYMSGAESLYASRTRAGRKTAHLQNVGKEYQSYADSRNTERFEDYLNGDHLNTGLGRINKVHNRRQTRAAALRDTTHGTHRAHSDAEALKSLRDAEGEAHYQRDLEQAVIGDGSRAAQIREARVNTVSLSGQADISKNVIEKQGQELLKRTVRNSADLTRQVSQAHQFEKTAEQYETIVQKAAEAAYDQYSERNDEARTLRFDAIRATDNQRKTEASWNKLIENVRAQGSEVGHATSDTEKAIAEQIKSLGQGIEVQQWAAEAAKRETQSNMSKVLRDNEAVRVEAGGIGDVSAQNRVYAKAKKDIVSAQMEDIENSRSVLSEYTAKELVKLHTTGIDRSNNQVYNPVTGEGNSALVDAAMQEILLNKGNNWAFQKTRDRVADMGMIYDEENGEYYDLKRDQAGEVIRNPITGKAERGTRITDSAEIERRRDVSQLFADAAKKSGLKLATLSQTELSGFESGTTTSSGHEAIIRDIIANKFDQEKIVGMDVDELQRMVQLIRRNDVRDHINSEDSEALGKLLNVIDKAQANPQINGRIKDRERGVMNAIASYIDPADTRSTDNKAKERTYWVDPANNDVRATPDTPGAVERTAKTVASDTYDINSQ